MKNELMEKLKEGDPAVIGIERDRSLHTLLSQSLLSGYLDSMNQDARSQLLFTTHDVLLMDQKIFRRDEMWVTERDPMGCASLIAFSDYPDFVHFVFDLPERESLPAKSLIV